MPTAGFQNQEGLSAKERTGDAEGGSFLIFVHAPEIRMQSQETSKESKRASVSFSCQGACMVHEGWWSCRAERAEHARGRRYAGVCPLKVRVHPHRAL